MSAIACLRIAVAAELRFADSDRLAPLVAKVASAYLETTWLWPRRFGLVAPFAFVLTDPRAERLDARELQALALDLQCKLFGQDSTGDVCLLLLEGDKTEVMHFAGLHLDEMQPLIDGQDTGQFTGRICRITPTEVSSVAPPGGPVEGAPPLEELRAQTPAREAPKPNGHDVRWAGIYHVGRESFVGSRVLSTPNRLDGPMADPDDPFMLERDLVGFRAVQSTLASSDSGHLVASFSFSSLIRPSMREAVAAALADLPADLRERLGVLVRHVPREPSYTAVSTLLKLFRPYFGTIGLHTDDPDFRVDGLPPAAVTCVSLAITGRDQRSRVAAMRRFAANGAAYRAKRIQQGFTGVVSPAELELCRNHPLYIVAGPAVCEPISAPCPDVAVPMAELPYPHGLRQRARKENGGPVAGAAIA